MSTAVAQMKSPVSHWSFTRALRLSSYKEPAFRQVNECVDAVPVTRREGIDVRFKDTEMVQICRVEDGFVSARYPLLGIESVGETLSEALDEFWENVAFVWRNYAEADDKDLTLDAIALKKKALQYLTKG